VYVSLGKLDPFKISEYNDLIYRNISLRFTESGSQSFGILRGRSFFCRSHGGVGRTCEVGFCIIAPAMLLYKLNLHVHVITWI